ncbi:hypothetical protein FQR65_LT18679 [Abscondita terminalis]|nr:hypothetical protein FQR65_LT18679 [Abscondita terminalis]
MTLKSKTNSKRVVFTDSDVCTLVNLVYKYKNTVECKKTDVYTWKEKVKDTSGATEPRTVEQLRTKYDNLKKETRRYFARQRQNLYRTWGGPVEDDIRRVIRDIYEKIKAIINLSVQGMEPRLGDSDSVISLATNEINTNTIPYEDNSIFQCEPPHDLPPATGDVKITDRTEKPCTITNVDDIVANNTQVVETDIQINDGSTYTKALQEVTIVKSELLSLKYKLLLKEDQRNEELHKERLEGQRLLNEKLHLQNIERKLKNELLSLKIANLKKSIEN